MTVGVINFPVSLDTLTELIRAINRPVAGWPTLTLAIGASDLTINVSDATSFPTNGVLVIENEIIYYASKSGNVITVETGGRGKEGTTAASHTAGVSVRAPITARHHNALADAILAIETLIGTTGATLTVTDLFVTDDAVVSDLLNVNGLAHLDGGLVVTGNTSLVGNADVNGTLQADGALSLGTASYATTGMLNLQNNVAIAARNVAGSGDVEIARINASDELSLFGAIAILNSVGTLRVLATSGNIYLGDRFSADTVGANILLSKSRNATRGAHTIVQNGDTLGSITFLGSNGTAFETAAQILGVVDGAPGASADMPGRIVFLVAADGTATPTEALRISNTKAVLAKSSVLSDSPTAGLGYATGAGGTVTQITSKATGVTLNKICGQITMNNAALASDTTVSFTLTDSAIAAGDVLVLNHISGGTIGSYLLNAQSAAGSATINVRNITAGSLSEAIVIAFAVVKAVTA